MPSQFIHHICFHTLNSDLVEEFGITLRHSKHVVEQSECPITGDEPHTFSCDYLAKSKLLLQMHMLADVLRLLEFNNAADMKATAW